jgi:plasmid stabilization system protein ParE
VSLKLRIAVRAANEVERADAWWRQNRLAAPEAVRQDLERTLKLLLLQPGIGQRVANTRLAGVRRIHVDRIQHHVYYRVQGNDLVVLRFWPAQRLKQPRL